MFQPAGRPQHRESAIRQGELTICSGWAMKTDLHVDWQSVAGEPRTKWAAPSHQPSPGSCNMSTLCALPATNRSRYHLHSHLRLAARPSPWPHSPAITCNALSHLVRTSPRGSPHGAHVSSTCQAHASRTLIWSSYQPSQGLTAHFRTLLPAGATALAPLAPLARLLICPPLPPTTLSQTPTSSTIFSLPSTPSHIIEPSLTH